MKARIMTNGPCRADGAGDEADGGRQAVAGGHRRDAEDDAGEQAEGAGLEPLGARVPGRRRRHCAPSAVSSVLTRFLPSA